MVNVLVIFVGLLSVSVFGQGDLERDFCFVDLMIGDTSQFDPWFQEVLQRKVDIMKGRYNDISSTMSRSPGANAFLYMGDEDLSDIEGIPTWFDELQVFLETKRADKLVDATTVKGSDDFPDWFIDWYLAYKKEYEALSLNWWWTLSIVAEAQVDEEFAYLTEEILPNLPPIEPWLEEALNKKIDQVKARYSGRTTPMPRIPGNSGLLYMREEDLAGIEGIPAWFNELQDYLETRRVKLAERPTKVKGSEDYPEWFKEWYNNFKHNHFKVKLDWWWTFDDTL